MDYCFSKSLRLLNASDYQAVFNESKLKVSSAEVLFLARHNNLGHARLGLVIAKKNIRLAVQRNRIKRVIRETFRLQQHHLQGIDVIVLARKNLDKMDNTQLHDSFNKLWRKLEKRAVKRLQDANQA